LGDQTNWKLICFFLQRKETIMQLANLQCTFVLYFMTPPVSQTAERRHARRLVDDEQNIRKETVTA
jgi:hypothetical protein